MTNFYLDNEDIRWHLQNLDLQTIVALREDDFTTKQLFPEAPEDYADALDNYAKILEIVGEISGAFIAKRAAEVDSQGATWRDGEVFYAKGTAEALERLSKADLMGFTLPRQFGGLNCPKTIYVMAIEIVSRADAALMNIFGLQEIADTIHQFGTTEQQQRYLPRFCRGEVLGAMAITEPDAGSDVQAVALQAREQDGKWYLNGVKRFITNGCAKISLVLARSEKVSGGRGLSLFIYEREPHMTIRRIEDKYGIHGSPTCELQFNDAPAELLGQRKFGLIKYTMSLMNGARLAVAAQAVGIAEAAYRAAYDYAQSRVQFGKPIAHMMAVREMLTDMQVTIEAGRALLYETAQLVDYKESVTAEELLKKYNKYAALFTPALKIYVTEMGNQVCYDAMQIHGGNGYMRDFSIERHVRDMRITNIYEGTTQLQVLAAIGGMISGVIFERLDDYEQADFTPIMDLFKQAQTMRQYLSKIIEHVKAQNDKAYQEFHERRIVEIGTQVIISYLLCLAALHKEHKKVVAHYFISKALSNIKGTMEYILTTSYSILPN